MARRVVGIDLGTTHSVLAWTNETKLFRASEAIEIFLVPQLASPTEIEARPLLPSFLYAPAAGESAVDPWGDHPYWAGAVARRRGTEVPGRSIASAKSWLGYAAVDRTAPILPWGADDELTDLPKISPLDASAKILHHLRAAFDAAHPNAPLPSREAQNAQDVSETTIVLTVPASFDEDARELTVEAARRAGLSVRLLEEPQAAFYDYMSRAPEGELRSIVERAGGSANVLVCDIGGGTTDLSLLRASIDESDPTGVNVTRIAVGNHLLLGGDNMDLALAHVCEGRLVAAPDRLAPSRFAQLVLACRTAKEVLLGENAPESYAIAVAAQGSKLFGSTLRTDLARSEVERLVLDGFFPKVDTSARPTRGRSALVAFGLPYEKDPAITKHIAAFLARHSLFGRDHDGPRVDAVLFNGGVFRAQAITKHLIGVLNAWTGHEVAVLGHTDPDLAVARGAVAYGLALAGKGVRIRGGAARGHYVGLASKPNEVRQAVCIVPRGAEEGVVYTAQSRTFALALGRSVRFDLFTSDSASNAPGDIVTLAEDVFEKLPPIAVRFDAGARASSTEVMVCIEGELSAVGTLDLACVEANATSPRRYALAFQLRDTSEETQAQKSRRTFSEQKVAQGCEAIYRVFGPGKADVSPREVKDLFRDLEKILGDRAAWTIEVARCLFDALAANVKSRKRSSDHERLFWQLAGFCLRPGFGDPGDATRAALIAPLFAERLSFQNETRNWQQYWIAWRRFAGGLSESAQLGIRDAVDPFLAPAEQRLKKPKGWKPDALAELLDMVASLERVPAGRRAELGAWILEKTWTDRDPRWWGALGRIGARVPAYASVHHVVSATVAERWLDQLLRDKWEDLPTAPGAAVQLARVTDDRARDVSPRIRAEVERRLVKVGAKAEWVRAVREFSPVEEGDRAAFFGEGLPAGLRLLG
ncbi:MAG: hsp70 family protein [Polyangiaceae bacterium]|nr:hsp70 family protein [Polyangiaceae bacterium]